MENNEEELSDFGTSNETLEELMKLSTRCRDLLKQISADHGSEDQAEARVARDLMTSFNIWSVNMGAFRNGKQSMASRLKGAPRISKLVQHLLVVLEFELENAAELPLEGGNKKESASCSVSEYDRSSDRSSTSYRLLDAQTTEHADGQSSSPYVPQSATWSSIQTTITSLRQVEMTVHLAGAAHRQERLQHYKTRHLGWYKMHERIAREKIDRDIQFQNASDILRERAAESIAIRRMRFSYLERHKEKMHVTTLNEPAAVPQQDRNSPPAFQMNQQPTIRVSALYQDGLEQGSHLRSSRYTVPTKLDSTKLDPGHMNTKHAESVTSVRITNFKNFPSPPVIDRKTNSFTCPFCLLECSAEEAGDLKSWSNHVRHDLQPFFCVLDDCSSPFDCGNGYTAWLDHMRDKHTRPAWCCWYCKTGCSSTRSFQNPDELDSHLEQEHRNQVTDPLRPPLVKHSMIRPSHALSKDGCPFCGGFPMEVEQDPSKWENESVLAKLEKHVKDHLEYVALMLLPKKTEGPSTESDSAQSEASRVEGDSSKPQSGSSESDIKKGGVRDKYELECRSEGCDRQVRSDLDFTKDISPGHDIWEYSQIFHDVDPTWKQIQARKSRDYENDTPPLKLLHQGPLFQDSFVEVEDSLPEDSVTNDQLPPDQIHDVALPDKPRPNDMDSGEAGSSNQKETRAMRSSLSNPTTVLKSKEQADNQHTIARMATKQDLYRALYDSRRSDDLSRRKYIPNSELRRILLRENVITELREHRKRMSFGWVRHQDSAGKLADRILEHGTRLFAIFVDIGLSWEIKNLLDAGLTDKDLPLLKSGNRLTSSVDPAKIFEWPIKWELRKLGLFAEAQWLLLAPIFCTKGKHKDLAQECPLPYVQVEEVQNTPSQSNVVYKVLIDPSHHEGLEIEAPSLELALKEFRFREHFETERENLNRIRGSCLNKHITQSFATYSQGKKTYIMFPWPEGGDLDNFWNQKNLEVRSPQLAVWCLRQMLGLVEALEILHNEANLRHGDLNPGHILNFLTGGPYGVLKLAGFGNSCVLKIETLQRHETAIETRATTPSYEHPEALLRRIPPSRKNDIWSLGCIFLEFTIWFLQDWNAVEDFSSARRYTTWGDAMWAQFYQKTDSTAEFSIEVHPAVVDKIATLRRVAEGAEGTAFGELLDIIEFKLLRVEMEERVDAKTLCALLTVVLNRAHGDQD